MSAEIWRGPKIGPLFFDIQIDENPDFEAINILGALSEDNREIKVSGQYPTWLAKILNGHGLEYQFFSKYDKAYLKANELTKHPLV